MSLAADRVLMQPWFLKSKQAVGPRLMKCSRVLVTVRAIMRMIMRMSSASIRPPMVCTSGAAQKRAHRAQQWGSQVEVWQRAEYDNGQRQAVTLAGCYYRRRRSCTGHEVRKKGQRADDALQPCTPTGLHVELWLTTANGCS